MANNMTVSEALEIVKQQMRIWCDQCDEETGEQCPETPVWKLTNSKHNTRSLWCEKHKPSRRHYADFIDPYKGAAAFAVLVEKIESTSAPSPDAVTTAVESERKACASVADDLANMYAESREVHRTRGDKVTVMLNAAKNACAQDIARAIRKRGVTR
jgi:hypothetical protein